MEITQELVERLYKHKLRKLSYEEISTLENIPVKTVDNIFSTHLSFLRDVDVYEEHKTDILMGLQKMCVGLMIKKADKATFRDLSTAFGILEDKLNLRQGKATQNIAVGMSIRLEDLVTRKERLEKNLLEQGVCRTELPAAIESKLLEDKKNIIIPAETVTNREGITVPASHLHLTSVFS
jgi:hypothetical protein